MNKRICVYAICKNEEQFIDRYVDSMSEADKIFVLDTGSHDNSVQKLRERGVIVFSEIISPWRFDKARNRALELIPDFYDICVCTDLDEVFNKGWREELEKVWNSDTKKASYRYTWSFLENGEEGVVFWIEKIHARHGFKWVHPVHEVLEYIGKETLITIKAKNIQLNHYPDNTKPRSQYLPLLEMSVKEEPDDDRNMHYLGREYMYNSMWEKCIETLKKHLELPKARWDAERAASMRYIAKSYNALGNINEAKKWYCKAVAEASYLREPYMDFAAMCYSIEDWFGVIYFTKEALKIEERPMAYICEPTAWGSIPYDLLAVAFYYIGDYNLAEENELKAIELSPYDERLKDNLEYIRTKINAITE